MCERFSLSILLTGPHLSLLLRFRPLLERLSDGGDDGDGGGTLLTTASLKIIHLPA